MCNKELLYEKSKMLANAVEKLPVKNNMTDYEKTELIEQWISQREFYPYQFITLLGMGTGKCIRNILEHMQKESILIVYEPYKENVSYLYNEEFADVLADDRVQIVVEGLNDEEFSYLYGELMTDVYQNQLSLWQHPYYMQIKDEVIKRYEELIRDGMEYHQVLNNSRRLFYKDYHVNVVHGTWNLQDVKAAEELGKIIPKDTLVVLVAAGPSLEAQLSVLKEKREKILIVAVYRVVDYLLENGIIPDFITTIDFHQKAALCDSGEIAKIPVILSETSSPELWEQHDGVKFLGALESYCNDILQNCGVEMNSFRTQPSVAAWQLLIMAEFGIERIALVGQDLAYQGENSHVGGVKEEIYNSGEMVEGMDGNMVPTRGDWLIHKQAIETIIQCHPEVTVYDTKELGAKIKHTKKESLTALIDKYGNDNRKEIVNKVEKIKPLLSGEVLENYTKELGKSRNNVEIMLERANRLMVLAEGISKGKIMKPEQKNKAAREISQINTWMDEQKEMGLITLFAEAETEELADKLFTFNQDAKTEEKNTYLYLQEYYKYIVIGLEQVRKTIEKNMQ